MPDGASKGLIQRIVERLTGREFVGPMDPRTLECRPLVVRREDSHILFSANASVEVVPSEAGLMFATIAGEDTVPGIYVRSHRVTAATGPHAGRPGREGLVLSGFDDANVNYEWRIKGAADFRYDWATLRAMRGEGDALPISEADGVLPNGADENGDGF